MSENAKHILVIGAACIDTKGRAGKQIEAGTSISGTIRVSVGGAARNTAENLVRLGERVVLLSAVGNDGSGRRILSQAAECGIDVSHFRVDSEHHTAAYLVVLDEEGNRLISIDDMHAIPSLLTPSYIYRHRRLFRDAQLVVLDANLTPASLDTVFRLARQYKLPVCADPTTAGLAPRLLPHLPQLTLVTPNDAEAYALCGVVVEDRQSALVAAQKLVGMGVKIAILTLGATGLVYATSQESGNVPAIESEIVDLTGTGDALTAAVIFGLLNDLPIGEAVRLGVSAASLTLQCRESVCPDLSLERLYDRL
jgi:pseudouridine kinase